MKFYILLACVLNLLAISSYAYEKSKAPQRVNSSLNSTFEKRMHADGEAAEEADIALGKYIRKNPRAFLKSYARHSPVIRPDAVVGNLGPAFDDDFKKQKIEVSKRIEALKTVNDPELQKSKAECLGLLEKFLAELNKADKK